MTDRRRNPILSALMQGSIAFQRAFLIFGGPNVALMLSQACYWQSTKTAEEYWYKQDGEWLTECGLTRKMLINARTTLQAHGILRYKVMGCPATSYYNVDEARLSELLAEHYGYDENDEGDEPVRPKGTNWNDQKGRTSMTKRDEPFKGTKNTTEITTEITLSNSKSKSDPIATDNLLGDEIPPTKEQAKEQRLIDHYHELYRLTGLPAPPSFPARDKSIITSVLAKKIPIERIAKAWAYVLSKGGATYWPLHCVYEKLSVIEFEMNSHNTVRPSRLPSADDIKQASEEAWRAAFGGRLEDHDIT